MLELHKARLFSTRIAQANLSALVFAILAALLATGHASAGSLPISIHNNDAPAIDLLYQGHTIDRDQAIDLKNQGIDLSRLDPEPNDVWGPESLPAATPSDQPDSNGTIWNFPADGGVVTYDSSMPSSQGLFRARVLSGEGLMGQPFQLMGSLSAHAAMARAALLRRLGYPVATPRWYRNITLKFKDAAARTLFIDTLSDATLTSRDRWVVSAPQNSSDLTIQDIVLEPAQIDVPMYHWGVIPATHLKGRRAVRALIVPLVLLDITESVNLFSYEVGKILDNNILLTHQIGRAHV